MIEEETRDRYEQRGHLDTEGMKVDMDMEIHKETERFASILSKLVFLSSRVRVIPRCTFHRSLLVKKSSKLMIFPKRRKVVMPLHISRVMLILGGITLRGLGMS